MNSRDLLIHAHFRYSADVSLGERNLPKILARGPPMAIQEVSSGKQGSTLRVFLSRRFNVGHIPLVLLATLLTVGMGRAYPEIAGTQVASGLPARVGAGLSIRANLPSGVVGTPYSGLVSATGVSPYGFSVVDGALPRGLALNSATGAVTGAPTTART